MAYEFYNGEVVDIKTVTPVLKRYFLRVNDLDNFDFTPGQFVMLDLPIESKRTTRSYSIASRPDGTNIFELIIVLKPDGAGTPYLFDEGQVQVGTKVKISKAIGKFVLPDFNELPDEICFICTGTGIAPFRAMIQDMLDKGETNKKINLIFGCRYQQDMLYRKEFESLKEQMPGFSYWPVLSRETNDSWKGEKGYVHGVYEKLYANGKPAMFYICGWKEMIMQARAKLMEMGYDKSQIKFELYD